MSAIHHSRRTVIAAKRGLLEQAARDLVDGVGDLEGLRRSAQAFVLAERAGVPRGPVVVDSNGFPVRP